MSMFFVYAPKTDLRFIDRLRSDVEVVASQNQILVLNDLLDDF